MQHSIRFGRVSRASRYCLMTFLLALAAPCVAQGFQCGVSGIPITATTNAAPFLAVTPGAPNAAQVIVLTVGSTNFNPQGAVATVQGNVVNITFTANYLGFATPPALSCSTATVGPLAAGSYAINVFLVQPFAFPTPALIGTGTLLVVPDPSAIPTISDAGIAALALLLSVAGWLALRRRSI